ncbi:MAG TPA: hypothetical protein VKX17_04980 [Planctomycetota bacterium]|nr:hypothetical protein [Planctomycetota bacterium]
MNEKCKMDWVVNGLLAAILVLLAGNYISQHAFSTARAGTGWDTDGITVMTTAANERLVVVDTQKKNIMIYHAQTGGKFGLTGVRSYEYDVLAEDTSKQNVGSGLDYLSTKVLYEKK